MSLQVCDILHIQFSPAGTAPVAQSIAGLLVGDRVLNIYDPANANPWPNSFNGLFEEVVSVNDQLQQTGGGNLSSHNPLDLIVIRPIKVS